MNAALHSALCGSRLRALSLDRKLPRLSRPSFPMIVHPPSSPDVCFSSAESIVFADLELLLLAVPTLEILRLEGGVDNVDHRDDVASENHKAPLKHLRIRSHAGRLGPQQLCWLVSLPATTYST